MADLYNPRHPHEPDLPVVLDDEGRCRVCLILVERDRLVDGIREHEANERHVLGDTEPAPHNLMLWSLLDVAGDDRERHGRVRT